MAKATSTDEKLKEKVREQLKQKAMNQGGNGEELGESDFDAIDNPTINVSSRTPAFFSNRLAKTEDVSMFFREMAILIESGYPLLRALTLLANKTSNAHLAGSIERIAIEVEKGSSLAKAMSFIPWYFSPIVVSMVEAGEAGGKLVPVLTNIADDIDASDELSDKVKEALAYPILTFGVALLVFFLILAFVVPTFANVYAENKMELPAITSALVWMSSVLTDFWWLWIPLVGGVIFYIRNKMSINVHAFDGLVLRIPLIRDIVVLGSMAKFASSLMVLLDNGVPIMRSLELSKGSVDNIYLKKIIQKMRDNVEAGKSMSQPLTEISYLPPIMVDMMFVGEESGKLPFVLGQIISTLKLQLNRIVSKLSITLGPVMTLFVGGMVLLITLSLFIPYFDFLSSLGEIR